MPVDIILVARLAEISVLIDDCFGPQFSKGRSRVAFIVETPPCRLVLSICLAWLYIPVILFLMYGEALRLLVRRLWLWLFGALRQRRHFLLHDGDSE